MTSNGRAPGWASGGIEPDDRVGLLCGSSPEFVVAYLGILGLGAVVVPVNPASPAAEVDGELAAVRPTAVVVGPSDERDREWLAGRGYLAIDTAELVASTAPAAPIVDRLAEDPAALMFTSGTAGFPKAAVLTHGNLLANIEQMELRVGTAATSEDVSRSPDPAVPHLRAERGARRPAFRGRGHRSRGALRSRHDARARAVREGHAAGGRAGPLRSAGRPPRSTGGRARHRSPRRFRSGSVERGGGGALPGPVRCPPLAGLWADGSLAGGHLSRPRGPPRPGIGRPAASRRRGQDRRPGRGRGAPRRSRRDLGSGAERLRRLLRRFGRDRRACSTPTAGFTPATWP